MAKGRRRKEVAVLAGVSLPTVDRWVDRYANSGLASLEDGSHAAPREQVPAAVRAGILATTRATPPPQTRAIALVEPAAGHIPQTNRRCFRVRRRRRRGEVA